MTEEEFEILEGFTEKISKSEDLDPKYQQFVSEHFWELIGDNAESGR